MSGDSWKVAPPPVIPNCRVAPAWLNEFAPCPTSVIEMSKPFPTKRASRPSAVMLLPFTMSAASRPASVWSFTVPAIAAPFSATARMKERFVFAFSTSRTRTNSSEPKSAERSTIRFPESEAFTPVKSDTALIWSRMSSTSVNSAKTRVCAPRAVENSKLTAL